MKPLHPYLKIKMLQTLIEAIIIFFNFDRDSEPLSLDQELEKALNPSNYHAIGLQLVQQSLLAVVPSSVETERASSSVGYLAV